MARASQSRPVLGYSEGFIQSPCSRQRMCILVLARLQATAAPEAPAPAIRTSTGSCIRRFLPLVRSGSVRPDSHQLFAEIGAFEKPHEGGRCAVDAVGDGFLVPDLAL